MAGNIYGVSQVSEITPYLYLTSVYGATKENIIKKGITLLVNSAQELPKQEIGGVESIKLFLDDTPYALINVYFDRMADKIHEHTLRGGRSLVHCVLGVSRSTSLVLAYLMKYKNMSLKNAFDFVASRRPCVRPNPGFWRQLLDYEKKLLTSHTEKARQVETSIPISIASNTKGSYGAMQSQRETERPYSSSRYNSQFGRNSFSGDLTNPNLANKSSSYSKLSNQSYNAMNNYSNARSYKSSPYFDYNLNPSSSGLTYLTTNAPGPHRSSLILNEEPKYANNRNSTFSTTYRSSYGKF